MTDTGYITHTCMTCKRIFTCDNDCHGAKFRKECNCDTCYAKQRDDVKTDTCRTKFEVPKEKVVFI